jgi:hypothetical protein
MGVAVARRDGIHAGRTHRAYHRWGVSPARDRHVKAGMRLMPAAPWWPDVEQKTFWGRMKDDRELIPVKVLLLTSLLLITAMLERVA